MSKEKPESLQEASDYYHDDLFNEHHAMEVMPVEHWIPACGGTERAFTVNGVRWQYMWCRETGKHAYYNLDEDIIYDNPSFHPCNAISPEST